MKFQKSKFIFVLAFSIFLSNAFAGENSDIEDGFTVENSTDRGIAGLELVGAMLPIVLFLNNYDRPEKLRLDKAEKAFQGQKQLFMKGLTSGEEYLKASREYDEARRALTLAESSDLRNMRNIKYRSMALAAEFLIVGDLISRNTRRGNQPRVPLNTPFGKKIYGVGEAGVENVRGVLEDVGLVRHRPIEETNYDFNQEVHYTFEEKK